MTQTYADILATLGADALEFLVSQHGFVADQPWASAEWNAARLVYRRVDTFVVADMAPREATFNICLGYMDGGRLPTYPIFRPRQDEPLTWVPVWALAQRDGQTVERFRYPGADNDALRSELARWAGLLKTHGAALLSGSQRIEVTGALLPPLPAPPDLSRQGESPPLVIGQSQLARILPYAQATGSSVFAPKEVLDEKRFLEVAASFMRGALRKGLAIRDIGPDPLVQGDGGFLYSLWRGVIEYHGETLGAAASATEAEAPRHSTEGPEMYTKLRTAALDAVRLGLPEPPAEHAGVAGAVIDVPAEGGFVTLVAMGEGTTSMYTSVGGGTIGAGGHPPVAAATHALLSTLDAHLGAFKASDDQGHPPAGKVRFFVLTPEGRRLADIPEDAFWGRVEHPLMPVVMAAQQVITELGRAPGPAQR